MSDRDDVALRAARRAARRAHLEAELHASRRSSARRRIVALAAVAVVAVLAPAAAVAAYVLAGADPPGAGTWTWDGRVPGRPVDRETRERLAQFSAIIARDPVEWGSIREVVRLETSRDVHRVLAARGQDGRICFAVAGPAWGGFSHCVPPPEYRPFTHPLTPVSTLLERQSDSVLLHFRSDGGPEPRTVGWATIVGVARSDVTRIVAMLPDGSELELRLNEWRGFGYSAAPEQFPTALVAYGEREKLLGSDEYVIEHVPLGRTQLPRPSPLCGGAAGPCDSVLERLSRRARARAKMDD